MNQMGYLFPYGIFHRIGGYLSGGMGGGGVTCIGGYMSWGYMPGGTCLLGYMSGGTCPGGTYPGVWGGVGLGGVGVSYHHTCS